MAGTGIGLAAVSLGLGIASMATYDSDTDERASSTWVVAPIILAGDATGIALLGSW